MKSRISPWLKTAALVALALGAGFGALAGDATGTWKWSTTGRNGQTTETTLKMKLDGDKLTGAFIGRNGNETAIESAKVQGDEISFSLVRERNGQTRTTKYQGKLSGDTIKGTIQTERNGQVRSRDWEAKREGAPVKAAGTWKWTFTTSNGDTIESTLKLQQAGEKFTGTLTGRFGESEVQDGKLNGDELSFTVKRERDGQTFTSKYAGKIRGDTIKGKSEMTFGDQTRTRDWEAKRAEAAKATGTWQWTMTTPNGDTIERKLKLKQDGDKLTGVSIWNDNETPIQEAKIAGDEVSFQVVREFNGNKVTIQYRGKLEGDTLKGKITGTFNGEDRSFDWEAKRAKE